MNYSELLTLISSDESRVLELKKTTGELKDAMHTACAFLNTDGGWLIFGVAPASLKVVGQQVTDNTRREIAQALSLLEPAVDVQVEYIDVPNAKAGEQVIAMHFDGWIWGTEPYSYHGCAYYRIESTTKQMPRDMYNERLRASKPDYFAWERQVSDIPQLDKLDEKLIRGVVRLGIECGRLPETAYTEPIADILNKWRIISDGKALNAATALFTTDTGFYTQFTMRMARFRGTDKNEFIDSQRVEGNLFVLLNEAMNFFRKHLNMNGKIVGWVREDHLDIPAEALRETMLNALCHRLYERYNLTIGVAIYDDRIEIENPGVLPPQIDVTHIEQAHYSSPHNPCIANVLYQTGYIENWGSGIQRIISTCKKYGVALPTWRQMPGGVVVVTFTRNIEQTGGNVQENVQENVQDNVQDKLTARQRLILNLMRDDDTISYEQMSKTLNVSIKTIQRDVESMRFAVHREGGDYGGHWKVVKEE